MRLRYLGLILVGLVFATAPAFASDPPKPAPPDVKASVIPELTPADLADIRNYTAHAEDAAAARKTAADAAALAQAKAEKAQAILAAVNYKILAEHRLDPDEFVIDLVAERAADGSETRAWKIVRVPKAPPPAAAAPPK